MELLQRVAHGLLVRVNGEGDGLAVLIGDLRGEGLAALADLSAVRDGDGGVHGIVLGRRLAAGRQAQRQNKRREQRGNVLCCFHVVSLIK